MKFSKLLPAFVFTLLTSSAALADSFSVDRFILAAGDLAGGTVDSQTRGISPDGLFLTGRSESAGGTEAIVWSRSGGLVSIGDLPGATVFGIAYDASINGSVVVGRGNGVNGTEAFRWTQSGGMVGLGDLAGGAFDSIAFATDYKGNIVVGQGTSASGTEAFRWTQSGGMVGLGDLAGGAFSSVASNISGNGLVIVGQSNSSNGAEAFRWTQETGMVGLGDIAGGAFGSQILSSNYDGSILAGYATSGLGQEASIWTQATGFVGYGDLAGGAYSSRFQFINASGTIAAGYGTDVVGQKAIVWTKGDGLRQLDTVLTAAGIDLTGWTLNVVQGLSEDGLTFAGTGLLNGNNQAFLARISASDAGLISLSNLSSSLSSVSITGQQATQAAASGMGQSMFAARTAAGSFSLSGVSAGNQPSWSQTFFDPSRWAVFAVGSVGFGQDGNAGSLGVNGTFGVMTKVTDDLILGVGYLANKGRQDMAFEGSSDMDAKGASLIAAYEQAGSPWRILGAAFTESIDLDIKRGYQNGAALDFSRGETDGRAYGASLEVGRKFGMGPQTAIMPFAALDWSRMRLDGYTETGGAFPATVGKQDDSRKTARLGAEIARKLSPGADVRVRGAWAHALDDGDSRLTVTGAGMTVVTGSTNGDLRDWLEASAGSAVRLGSAALLSGEIGGRIGDSHEPAASLTLGLRIGF